jgi:phosphoglycerate dehydrogenase-like enzyme
MAEYIMTALLSASQRVGDRRELQVRKEWPASYIDYECYGLRGKTLVIVGYGGIGRETARLASAFGMRILAVKAEASERVGSSYREPGTGDPEGIIPNEIVGLKGIDGAFEQADYVVLTLPLTSASRGLMDRRLLSVLRPGAWIVNVARGAIIDEDALVEALREGRIGGAWLDVFRQEPLPGDSPLWEMANVIVTPHVSGGNRDSFRVLTDLCCENLRRYLAGQPLLNRVDPTKGY